MNLFQRNDESTESRQLLLNLYGRQLGLLSKDANAGQMSRTAVQLHNNHQMDRCHPSRTDFAVSQANCVHVERRWREVPAGRGYRCVGGGGGGGRGGGGEGCFASVGEVGC